jgi:hypothetical protein
LDVSKTYRIGFSGSYVWQGFFNTTYTIGQRTVFLNAFFNTSKVVYISDVLPNNDGEIVITISTAGNSLAGFLSAMTVESYTGLAGNAVQSPLNAQQRKPGSSLQPVDQLSNESKAEIGKVYPNPFDESVNVEFYNPSENKNVTIEIYDLTGRMVYNRNVGNVIPGKNNIILQSLNKNMSPGVYMLRLNINGRLSKTVKLIKASH